MSNNQNAASEETNLTFVRVALLQSTMEKFPTTDATGGADHLEAFTVIGPIVLVVISAIVVYLVVSFVKFRLDRQQRRKEALVTHGPTIGQARMLAYSLPYNVLHLNRALANYRRPTIVNGTIVVPVSSSPPPATVTADGKPIDRSLVVGGRLSTDRPGAMMQLSVKPPSADGYVSASFLDTSDVGSLNDLSARGGGGGEGGSVFRRRSPVPVESKSRLKRLKKRRIRPFSIMDDFKRREKPDAAAADGGGGDGEGAGAGGGIMFINQYYGYESSSTTTSTFQMRLDQR